MHLKKKNFFLWVKHRFHLKSKPLRFLKCQNWDWILLLNPGPDHLAALGGRIGTVGGCQCAPLKRLNGQAPDLVAEFSPNFVILKINPSDN